MAIRFIDEILQEARERFGPSGYGQDELLRLTFEMIRKRMDELKQEYTDNAFSDFGKGWNEGYHVSLDKVKEMFI